MRLLSLALSTGSDGRWHPGIGDPSVLGWVTVLAYFTAAYLALSAARSAQVSAGHTAAPEEAQKQRLVARFWRLTCAVMVVLGINKQLDLQSLLTELARDVALAQGWYEGRRRVQVAFVAGVMAVGTALTLGLAYSLRRVLSRLLGGLVGLGLIVSFVIVRAASFHHIDMLLKGPLQLNGVFELSGIGLIGYHAWRSQAADKLTSLPKGQRLNAASRDR